MNFDYILIYMLESKYFKNDSVDKNSPLISLYIYIYMYVWGESWFGMIANPCGSWRLFLLVLLVSGYVHIRLPVELGGYSFLQQEFKHQGDIYITQVFYQSFWFLH